MYVLFFGGGGWFGVCVCGDVSTTAPACCLVKPGVINCKSVCVRVRQRILSNERKMRKNEKFHYYHNMEKMEKNATNPVSEQDG